MRETYNEKDPKLVKSVVCFVDILGFSDIVKASFNAGNGNVLLRELHESINENLEFIKPAYDGYSSLKLFTDNIAIGVPIHEDGESELGGVFLGFASYQLSLALNGFFVRGGITIGEYYGDNNMSFGLPIIRAHELESQVANTPRIILDDIVVHYINKHIGYYAKPQYAPQTRDILIDIDGFHFVNYLEAAFEGRDEADFDIARKILAKHKAVVVQKITKFSKNPKVLSKYLWVAYYHNFFCSNHFIGDSSLIININGYGNFKTIGEH